MTFDNIANLDMTVLDLWEDLCTPELYRKLCVFSTSSCDISNRSRTIVYSVCKFPVGRLSLSYAKALVQRVLQRAVYSLLGVRCLLLHDHVFALADSFESHSGRAPARCLAYSNRLWHVPADAALRADCSVLQLYPLKMSMASGVRAQWVRRFYTLISSGQSWRKQWSHGNHRGIVDIFRTLVSFMLYPSGNQLKFSDYLFMILFFNKIRNWWKIFK